MGRKVLACLLAAGFSGMAHAGAVELTKDNYEAEVVNSGKNAFVKFLAPW
jgi:hypothetical protein